MSAFRELLGRVTQGKWAVRLPTPAEVRGMVRKYPSVYASDSHALACMGHVGRGNKRTPEEILANAQYIARLNPDTMKLVMEALERAQERLDPSRDIRTYQLVSEAIRTLNTPTP